MGTEEDWVEGLYSPRPPIGVEVETLQIILSTGLDLRTVNLCRLFVMLFIEF